MAVQDAPSPAAARTGRLTPLERDTGTTHEPLAVHMLQYDDTHHSEPAGPTVPARGLAIGLIFGLLLWAVIIAGAFVLLRA